MSKDLLTQLADYGDYCEHLQGSVALDDITSRGLILRGRGPLRSTPQLVRVDPRLRSTLAASYRSSSSVNIPKPGDLWLGNDGS
jgi:hypothetical protein